MKLTKGERATLLIVGGIVAFLVIQHRRAMASAGPAPARVALPGLPIPQQMTT